LADRLGGLCRADVKIAAWMATESWFRPPTAIVSEKGGRATFRAGDGGQGSTVGEGMDEEAAARPISDPWMWVWAETGAKVVGQAVRYFRALRYLAGNGQDRSTAISGYGLGGAEVDVPETP